MDAEVLADVLRTVRLRGALFFDVEAAAPWVAEAPHARELGRFVMPDAQHVIEYHILVTGACWVSLLGGQDVPVPLGPGSVVVFPQGDAHVLSSAPGMRARSPDPGIFRGPRPESLRPFMLSEVGDGPERSRLVCGFLGCDVLPFNPLLQALPRMLLVTDGYSSNEGWLAELIRAAVRETRSARAGGANVLARLSELIFIEAVRIHAERLPSGAPGWLAGLRSPQIGRAIRLLHGAPARPWALSGLAREAGVSRTVLAERFKADLGMPPMAYLAHWRMQIASGLLVRDDATVSAVAAEVGYESEAAFSRAFKRCTGQSPAAWRASQRRRELAPD